MRSSKVAVLGGGIAGAAACIRLAQSGIKPIWVVPRQDLVFKPGEHLSASALPLLKEIHSDALLLSGMHRQAHSTYSAWGSELLTERNAIVQLEGPPNVLDRIGFEKALTQQAVAAGAMRFFATISDLTISDGRWCFVIGQQELHVDFLFDATGRKALVASKFSIRFQADQLACVFGLFTQPDNAKAPRPVTIIEADEQGWWYLTLLADYRVVVNYYSDADLIPRNMRGTAQGFWERACNMPVIGDYLDAYGFSSSGKTTLISTNTTWVAPVIGPGWVAIGDAAAAFDPLSSHGMTTALWTAITATDAYVSKNADKMHAYAENVLAGVQEFLHSRQQIYAKETRFKENEFWRRRTSMSANHP